MSTPTTTTWHAVVAQLSGIGTEYFIEIGLELAVPAPEGCYRLTVGSGPSVKVVREGLSFFAAVTLARDEICTELEDEGQLSGRPA